MCLNLLKTVTRQNDQTWQDPVAFVYGLENVTSQYSLFGDAVA